MSERFVENGTGLVDHVRQELQYVKENLGLYIQDPHVRLWESMASVLRDVHVDRKSPVFGYASELRNIMCRWLADAFHEFPFDEHRRRPDAHDAHRILNNALKTVQSVHACLSLNANIDAPEDMKSASYYTWRPMTPPHVGRQYQNIGRPQHVSGIELTVYGGRAMTPDTIEQKRRTLSGRVLMRENVGYIVAYYMAAIQDETIRVLHAAIRPPHHLGGAREEMASDILAKAVRPNAPVRTVSFEEDRPTIRS